MQMNPCTFISIAFTIGQTNSKSKVFQIEASKTEKQIRAANRENTEDKIPDIGLVGLEVEYYYS